MRKNDLYLRADTRGNARMEDADSKGSGVLRTGKGSEITWRHDCWRVAAAPENGTFKNVAY